MAEKTTFIATGDAYQNNDMAHETFVGEYMNNRSKNGTKLNIKNNVATIDL